MFSTVKINTAMFRPVKINAAVNDKPSQSHLLVQHSLGF
jgi:hypothetical protein